MGGEEGNTERMKRAAVVGLGKMGILHASILNCMPGVDLVGVADASKGPKRIVRGVGIGAPYYLSLEDMLTAQNPDAVFVCVPSSANHVIAETCLNNNVSMFVEKPLANNIENAAKMIEIAEGKNLKCSIGFMLAYVPTFRQAKEYVAEGILGKLTLAEATTYLDAISSPQKSWICKSQSSGGGAMVALGSHLIFLLNWMLGEARQVKAELVYTSGNEVEDTGRVEMELEGNIEASMDISWSAPGYKTMSTEIVFHGTLGKLRVSNQEIDLWLDSGGHTKIHASEILDNAPFYLGGEGYYSEDEEFMSLIGTDARPPRTWEEGYRVQKALHAIYESARTSTTVRVE